MESWRQAKAAATEIMECIEPAVGNTDLRRAYAVLKCWYRLASDRAPNPSRADIETVTGDFWALYHNEEPHPPCQPLETHMDPFQVKDYAP